MTKKRRKFPMLIPTIFMGILAIALLLIGYFKGQNQHIEGLNATYKMTTQIIPLLIFAFIVAGMVQVLLPQNSISKWIGDESGFRGILIGSVAGSLTPGGPFVSMPIALSLWQKGAGIGTMVAFLSAWSLLAIARMPMEVGIMGWKFTLIRLACTFFFPPIAGIIAQFFFAGAKPLGT